MAVADRCRAHRGSGVHTVRRRILWLVTALVAVVALGAAGGGAYFVLRTKGSPAQTARGFLAAWERGDLAAMRAAVLAPPADFDRQYAALRADLGVTRVRTEAGASARRGDDRASMPFTAALTMAEGTWRYDGRLSLVTHDRTWKVSWSPEAIHPELHAGQRLQASFKWPERGRVLAADGTPIDGTDVTGSVQQLVGSVAPATAKQVEQLGKPYQKGTPTGQSGIQRRYETRLAGTPATSVVIADASGRTVKPVGGFPAEDGQDVKTSLDLGVGRAASSALQGLSKPTSLVALRPSTGEILAVANIPGGFDRAMEGTYPPGSTFKVVTAYALLRNGLTPASTVSCPKTANVGGQVIHNAEGEEFGDISFKDAVAHSCNTAFAMQTQKLLNPQKLMNAAETFGFNQKIDPGVTVRAGSFPSPTSDAEMAVAGFGQGRDLANALSIAGVAGGVSDGTWRPPVLVTTPKVPQRAKPGKLDPGARAQLAEMMKAVVTSGTAKGKGLPAGTAGKTGTAEYGSGPKPPSHAWFMGYHDDIAFAVVVEDGGFGAKAAVPVVARFLKAL